MMRKVFVEAQGCTLKSKLPYGHGSGGHHLTITVAAASHDSTVWICSPNIANPFPSLLATHLLGWDDIQLVAGCTEKLLRSCSNRASWECWNGFPVGFLPKDLCWNYIVPLVPLVPLVPFACLIRVHARLSPLHPSCVSGECRKGAA